MNRYSTIYSLFEQAAELYPDELCIRHETGSLTYQEVEEKVSKVHSAILKHASNEKIIGVSTRRCIDQVVMVLAILKANKTYLPVNFEYPQTRLQAIIDNSNLSICLANIEDADVIKAAGLQLLSIKDPEVFIETKSQNAVSQNTTYILYTSGSTGEPKGVCMGQQATLNLINWQNQNSSASNGTRTLQFAPLSFDVSFQEIMATLSTGGTLVLISEDLRLDMFALLDYIEKQSVNRLFLPFVALQALADAAISSGKFPACLQEIMTAGEQLKITYQLRIFFASLNNCRLFNQYGPTECHVVSEFQLNDDPANWPMLPSIGKPIANTSIFILDERQRVVANGQTGELCIAGKCLAEGYLGNERLTKEKFIFIQPSGTGSIRAYRTGDMARYLPDGNIEFLGRKDEQVKISGHRIELAEVELALNKLSGIQQAVVIASNHFSEQPQLVAYLQSSHQSRDMVDFRHQVAKVLPNYMLPAHYVWVVDFPKTSSGKIDKKALAPPQYQRPSSLPLYKNPQTDIQTKLAEVLAQVLHIPKIGIDDNFFEIGGTSLLAQKTVAVLRQRYNFLVPIAKLYQFPTIAELAEYLNPNKKLLADEKKDIGKKSNSSTDIAIIGMAGRFPGAKSIEELWEVLKNGKETISFFKPEELDTTIPEVLRKDPLYVRARGVVPTSKEFDAAFFGLNPKVASVMDPQQRLFLEIAWEVLEQTGHLPKHYKGSIGVYAGTGTNTYYKNNVLPNKTLLDHVGNFQANTLNEKDYIASRTAYHLNLKGPAVSVHSACSTSLLAVAEAVEAIRNGQCDIALAGGASVTAPIYSGHLYQEGSILSPDGHCRPFDAEGKGTIFSDGAGVILLKSLESAEKDGDKIYGIIKGVGINNDGGNKGSFTAPSAEGQAKAIRNALQDARISSSTISYVEAHGTATPIGDPIEMEGLQMAFGKQATNGYCAVGSIKSNMGHLTAAAGVAGLIKTALAMYYKQIPPSLGFEKPNRAIDFANSPFFINQKLTDWKVAGPRRAGISSFGVGGTNVHIIAEEYENKIQSSDLGRPLNLLVWSARTENSLEAYGNALGEHLEKTSGLSLADVAYTLNITRETFNYRRFILTGNNSEAVDILKNENKSGQSKILKVVPEETIFLFPGQGAQYLQMGKNLYEGEKIFREAVDTCAELLMDELKYDIRQIIFPETNNNEAELNLKDTRYTQPALFVIEYALAQLWMRWGIKPTALCGHSIGEFVAAHLAGTLNLQDALHLITIRGKLVSELPDGSMLSVRLAADKLEEILPDSLSLAAINSDLICVVSGPDNDIKGFAEMLTEQNVLYKTLSTSHAFHSTMMDPVLETFKNEVKKIDLNIPITPIISSVTGKKLTDSEATDPNYWTNHLRATVRFSNAMDTILELENPVLIEVGPGRALTTLALQKKAAKNLSVLTSLSIPKYGESDYTGILKTMGHLWLAGLEPDWKAFYAGQSRQRVELPPYQFDRKPCWVNPISIETSVEFQSNIKKGNKPNENNINTKAMRKKVSHQKISEIIINTSGIELEAADFDRNFLEIGLDSLILTQLALTIKKEFNVPITFRQLNEEFATPELLANYIDKSLPDEMYLPNLSRTTNILDTTPLSANASYTDVVNQNSSLDLISQQLELLGKQIELLRSNETIERSVPSPEILTKSIDLTEEEKIEHEKPFGASPRIERQSTKLDDRQQDFLIKLIARYNEKTPSSKDYTQRHRAQMADPRVVSGFKPQTKELTYPLVIEKSSGNRLWDLDGNEYIDALNGFGSCLFGHQPDFIKNALKNQIELGYEIGPQHPLAGEVCELLCEFTGHERAAVCNTGSEAVLGAMRIARTVTGRSLIVAFSGSYHGINDEALVRGSSKMKTFPAAAGILPNAVQNMLILEYGTEESLSIIRERAHELAAVLVEPVQSRRPEFQPLDFLKQVREITAKVEATLIFDEVITGFRMHPGGAQALFDIKADLATYGKVIGGGLPIGAIMGKSKYMDALDGGYWQYGDQSYPEVGVTYFAGTFVRHPLALAAAQASLQYMKDSGPELQKGLTDRTEDLAGRLNNDFAKRKLPIQIKHFGSLWRLKFNEELPYSELLFVLLREKGIHIWDGFPCFITTAFSEDDISSLVEAFSESVEEMIHAGFFPSENYTSATRATSSFRTNNDPPVPGARLGRDENGDPAWFVANPKQKDEYIKIDL